MDNSYLSEKDLEKINSKKGLIYYLRSKHRNPKKIIELLDYEIEDTKFTILGPGWVRTKIHNQTLKAKSNAGMNYKKTLDMLATPNKFNPIKKVIDDVFKIIELPKELVSGRNFSSVHDDISLKKLKELYSIDKDFYRLRRNLNNN